MAIAGYEAVEFCPLPARKFGAGNLIWQLDELVEARVVCDSLPFLVPAMADPCLIGCVRWHVVQELVGIPGEGGAGL